MLKCSSKVIIITLVVTVAVVATVGAIIYFVVRDGDDGEYFPTVPSTLVPTTYFPQTISTDCTTSTSTVTESPSTTTEPYDEFDLDGQEFGSLRQDCNYANVTPGGQMFWWLFYASGPQVEYTEKPLIIWLQGLFDEASSGHGVFQIFKLYEDLSIPAQVTENSWVRDYNILFIDAPLGTGFSFVNSEEDIEQSTEETAENIVSLLISFYNRHPEFEVVPLHIFGQFYGAKVAVELSLKLSEATKDKRISVNLQSVALGNGLISPVDSLEYWGLYLENLGYVDADGRNAVDSYAKNAINSFIDGDYWQGAIGWIQTLQIAISETVGKNFYNVIEKPVNIAPDTISIWNNFKSSMNALTKNTEESYYKNLYSLMNEHVRPILGIPERIGWNNQATLIMNATLEAAFTPSNPTVSRILNETDIKVVIYNGNLDLLSNTKGQIQWVENLEWSGAGGFKSSMRHNFTVGAVVEGYHKSYENLHFYWINAAGLRTPADSPNGIKGMFKMITSVNQNVDL